MTGHFSVGSGMVSLTLPWGLYAQGAVLFQEVSAKDSSGPLSNLFLHTAGERVPVEDGRAISLKPKEGERIVFTLRDETGQALCAWVPAIRQLKGRSPEFPDGFLKSSFVSKYFAQGNTDNMFRNVGDPIALAVGGELAAGHGVYRIDDSPATVLARTSYEVIIRDPQPKAGLRTVESQGYATTIPFVEVTFALPPPREGRCGTLRIRVLGGDAVRQPGSGAVWPRARLLLFNSSQDRIQLLCGKSYSRDADQEDARGIRLTRESPGAMTGACKVRYRAAGELNLRGFVVLEPSLLR